MYIYNIGKFWSFTQKTSIFLKKLIKLILLFPLHFQGLVLANQIGTETSIPKFNRLSDPEIVKGNGVSLDTLCAVEIKDCIIRQHMLSEISTQESSK